ncbi:MAG: hypothetical protein JOZ19_05830 [Rubrobacter sp.]|nr:hypothetical protein [Rubrobacter sp.]
MSIGWAPLNIRAGTPSYTQKPCPVLILFASQPTMSNAQDLAIMKLEEAF